MEKKLKIKVGDVVYDPTTFGKGIIEDILDGRQLPIKIRFGKGRIGTYTIDGRISSGYPITLSLKPYELNINPIFEEVEEVWGLFWDDDKRNAVFGKLAYGRLVFIDVNGKYWLNFKQIDL